MDADEPEYRKRVEGYSVHDLADVLKNMDREAHPLRYEIARQALAAKQGLPEPDTESAERPVEGIGGWLLLPLIGLCITPFSALYGLYSSFSSLTNFRVIAVMTDEASAYHFPYLTWLFAFEMTYSLVLTLFAIWTIRSFLWKKRGTPKLMIVFYAAGLVVHAGGYLFAWAMLENYPTVVYDGFKAFARSTLQALIWIPYFLKSKRVANTFIN